MRLIVGFECPEENRHEEHRKAQLGSLLDCRNAPVAQRTLPECSGFSPLGFFVSAGDSVSLSGSLGASRNLGSKAQVTDI